MDSDKNVYTEDDLRQLEQRIDELIDTVGSLKNENTSLRQQKDKLVTERSQLIEKTEMARSRVEAMISRLRSLELGSLTNRLMTETLNPSISRYSTRITRLPARRASNPHCSSRPGFSINKMREVRDTGNIMGSERIAVITALNMANDLLKTSSVDKEIGQELPPRLKDLESKVSACSNRLLEQARQLEI